MPLSSKTLVHTALTRGQPKFSGPSQQDRVSWFQKQKGVSFDSDFTVQAWSG